ncbi:cell wall-binding repeat-containing protein [Ornithinimicrobium avium]|uniref:Peptidase S8 n=1 Tax=Ornithinimicrobium avium TaxID=2283195 RepID=A0A345NJX4_9MICO|nr:cell wall-binding repeat-containing protein [Ornithinimicrobium avium]AXH95332.1 peptidase S8 [Ornithinimicrobium avium]
MSIQHRTSRSRHSTGLRRRWVAGLTAGVLTLGGSLLSAAAAAPLPAAPGPEGKIQADVDAKLDDQGRATVLVRFGDRPDMTAFEDIEGWDERGQAVYDALTSTAESSQAAARATLDEAGVAYRSFFITNAILVTGGDRELLTSLALSPEVEGVYLPAKYDLPEPVVGEPQFITDAVEWGIADINADDVWSEFGATGEGIVVANIDTGVDYTHPALVDHYRGNNGDGTFTHDYNWFDAGGTGSDEPVDYDAHGTHTMGTMVGDDGGSNQIGVAPGATWIAANGCCPSDEALISSGEWMLAPTDLVGDNPRPDLRPNIINNSWGSGFPTNDPFMEDVAQAWAASGIFGVWSNGNMGPQCQTSGSPGSRSINYAVGAYDVDATIADFSSRGAGQDGAIKPDISAPGVDVRSSVPGGGYEAYSGTSMAAPHVAGTVALLWSAAPDLIGDVAFTRELLDGSAIDTPDDQCGGTDDDNNVYGEGRLDALALLASAPIGDTGRVVGTVTDSSTSDPVSGATVELQGERVRTTSTASDGTYGLRLGVGDWATTVSRFGYLTDSATVNVALDETTVHDVALDPAPSGTLSGTVTDGSGNGYPLYARISVQGAASVGTYTDPETGEYSLDLPVGTHVVRATSQLPGYQVASRSVVVVEADGTVADFALTIDPMTCTAPGYTLDLDGTSQSFDDLVLPAGWAVEDLEGRDLFWQFDDPMGIGNQTGGRAGFAEANSMVLGAGLDTVLVSPVVDASAMSNVTLAYQQMFDSWGDSSGAVEVSSDAGATWTEVREETSFVYGAVTLDLSEQLAGASAAQVRFRYRDPGPDEDFLWQVDDVFLGSRTCDPTGGGLVVGYVQDDIDGTGIVNAKVSSQDRPADVGTTRATPDDPELEDGFYWLHSLLVGTHPFVASARNYGTDTQPVDVAEGAVVRADFVLGQAVLSVEPTSISTSVRLGESDGGAFTVTNTGTSTAEITFGETRGGFEILRADGSRMTSTQMAGAKGAPLAESPVTFDPGVMLPSSGSTASSASSAPPRAAEEPWTDLPALPLPVLDNRVVSLDGQWYVLGGANDMDVITDVYRFDAVALEWMPVAPLPAPAMLPVAAAVGGRIVVSGGWGMDGSTLAETWIYDPAEDSWSSGAPMPDPVSAAGTGVVDGQVYAVGGCTNGECAPMSDLVQVYDPASDSWSQAAPLPEPISHQACGAVAGGLVCAGGFGEGDSLLDSTWTYDAASDSWSAASPAPVTFGGAASAAANSELLVVGGVQDDNVTNASWAYDPATDEWSSLPNANTATFRGGGACGFAKVGGMDDNFLPTDAAELLPGYDLCDSAGADVDWLFVDTEEATLTPGESVTVEVTTDSSAVNQPGTYTAGVTITANVPVGLAPVEVSMDVAPPLSWGKVTGTAYIEDCEGGQVAGDSILIDIAPVREGVGDGWVIMTDEVGTYARWINTQVGSLRMTATLGGFRPDTHLVTLVRGGTVTQDFSLLSQECQENPPGTVPPEVTRIAGLDRYATAARVSEQFAPGVRTVYVASGRNFPDALAAAARAGSLGGPVLLVRPDSVPAATRVALQRLDPRTVVVAGGTTAVSAGVESTLRGLVPDAVVSRRAGADRYGTAARIAAAYRSADVVYVAAGTNFPDALAGAARAADHRAPVLLVRQGSLPAVTASQLERLAPDRIVLLGGTSAVSRAVERQLRAYGTVERVAGDDRYDTAARLSQELATSQDVFVATGLDWPDALAGAARAGATGSPLLLVRTGRIPAVTWAELDRLDPGRVIVLGGTTVISGTVVDLLRTLE